MFTLLKTKKRLFFWFFVRVISTAGPLLMTFLFAKIVDGLTRQVAFGDVFVIASTLLGVHVLENLLRVGSKTRMEIEASKFNFDLQNLLLDKYNHKFKLADDVIQAIINLGKAVEDLLFYIKESGVNGVVNFVSIPVILFFLDKRIFAAELLLIALYLIVNFFLTKKYEKSFEDFDRSKEIYYSHVFALNNFMGRCDNVFKNIVRVDNMVFVMWGVLQNLLAFFQYVVIVMVGFDIFRGFKSVADLILIVGYTDTSQGFLNTFTSLSERFMEVKAGIKRLALLLPVF